MSQDEQRRFVQALKRMMQNVNGQPESSPYFKLAALHGWPGKGTERNFSYCEHRQEVRALRLAQPSLSPRSAAQARSENGDAPASVCAPDAPCRESCSAHRPAVLPLHCPSDVPWLASRLSHRLRGGSAGRGPGEWQRRRHRAAVLGCGRPPAAGRADPAARHPRGLPEWDPSGAIDARRPGPLAALQPELQPISAVAEWLPAGRRPPNPARGADESSRPRSAKRALDPAALPRRLNVWVVESRLACAARAFCTPTLRECDPRSPRQPAGPSSHRTRASARTLPAAALRAPHH